MRRLRTAPKILLPAIVIGIAAFWGVIDITEPPGPGLDPDALSYLGAGQSLAHGNGLRVPSAGWDSPDTTAPLVHFPPGFPAAIAVGVAAGVTPVNAARIVEAAAGAVSAVALVVTADAAGGALAALVVVAIAFGTPAFIEVHSAVLSEPLFLALFALFAWELSRERRGADTRRTIALGVISAGAVLVRYAGASLVLATMIDAWRSVDGPVNETWKERSRRTVLAAAIPAAALCVWALSRPHSEGAEKIREVGVYTKGFGGTVMGAFHTAARWLAPGVNSDVARTMAALAVFIAAWTLVPRTVRAARRGAVSVQELRLYRATAVIGGSYFVVIIASRLLADPGIPFDDRILAPLFFIVALRTGVALAAFWRDSFSAHREIVLLTIGVTASWVWGSTDVSSALIDDIRSDGGDLAGHQWSASPLVQWAASAPPGTHLYSNWPAAIWFHTGRAAAELPSDLDSASVRAFREKIAREHGAVLAFKVRAEDYAPPDSLALLAGLTPAEQWPDGTIWRSPAGAARPDSARLHP